MKAQIQSIKKLFLKTLFLSILVLLFVNKAHTESQCINLFVELSEDAKNEANLNGNKFNIGRRLLTYNMLLKFRDKVKSFKKTLQDLRPGSLWIDMGAGHGLALKDGLDVNKSINGLAISYKKPREFKIDEAQRGRLKYLDGDFIENLFRKGRLRKYINKASLVTDIVGPLSYSKDIQLLLNMYLSLLKSDGELFFSIISERNYETYLDHEGKSKRRILPAIRTMNTFEYIDEHGYRRPLNLIDWLRTIKGVEVEEIEEYLVKTEDTQGETVVEKYKSYRIKKISETVQFTNQLVPTIYVAGDPPVRSFTLEQ